MLDRREFLLRSLQTSSLLAVGASVPGFVASTARAAPPGKNNILVVVELSGGNDGLNTVVPYADDLYHKARPTLRFRKEQVIRVDDHIGLNPAMRGFDRLLQQGQLAIVQGVGYPNPQRSHFESMDIWQSADPRRLLKTGWIGRSAADLQDKRGSVPILQIGARGLPLALQGAPGGVVSINNKQAYRFNLGAADPARQKSFQHLLAKLSRPGDQEEEHSLLQFVERREVQTYATLGRLEEVLRTAPQMDWRFFQNSLAQKMRLVSQLIQRSFGTRVFYLNLDGFDTHSVQAEMQPRLLGELAQAVSLLFDELRPSGHDKRVLVMTFSEFGRRVQENGSKGTDHGAASCLFVAGPAVKGGPVNPHPSLGDLDAGDLRFQVDFRNVYATLLDRWLHCDSRTVLGSAFPHVNILRQT